MNKALKRSSAPTRRESGGAEAYFLDQALDLAWSGAGRTRSNPMVGAVVVKNGRIVGRGYHAAYGLDHAETVALDQAGDAAAGATLFVTLEPCTHDGQTPPCTDRIVESGVERVVVCTLDPDPRMDGKGVELLRAAGIQVDIGFCVERAVVLNLPYFKRRLNLGSAVTLKMAITLDGRIASRTGVRDAISAEPAQEFVHRLRASRDAVVVGINTLLIDSPKLDVRRLEQVDAPVPVVLDSRLRFPPDYPWLDDGRKPIVLTRADADPGKVEAIRQAGGRVEACAGTDRGLCLDAAIDRLARHGASSLLVEGGAEVFSAFLESGQWDDLHVIIAPAAFGPDGVGVSDRPIPREAMDAVAVEACRLGGDVRISYLNSKTRDSIVDRVA